ncbi:MAG TPA: methyltransferase domain-containing protein [Anaerolineaceae bacterium]|nr:methyltransferase domain-containing protein [Anaerolineaceae bacterium]
MLDLVDWHHRFLQQSRWTEELRYYLYHQLKIDQSQRILEVGCGSGVVTADLQRVVPVKIYGLDRRFEYLKFANQVDKATRFVCGDALALPYTPASFDSCLCHFFLLWLKHPEQGLKEMRRVTRPGGLVAALAEPDYGGRIDYPDELMELGRQQAAALQRQGADPNLGRRLASLFSNAGLSNVHSGLLGGHWGSPLSPEAWELEWSVLESDLSGWIDKEKFELLRKLDLEAWQKGQRILFVPTFYAWGTVPY